MYEEYIRENGSRGLRLMFPDGEGRTKQSFKDECDVNQIMARFQKTGAMTHFARHSGSYGFAPAVSYHEAVEIAQRAEAMFMDLPSKVRARFQGDPGAFLEFVQDPNNADEMAELGLRVPESKTELERIAEATESLRAAAEQASPEGAPEGAEGA